MSQNQVGGAGPVGTGQTFAEHGLEKGDFIQNDREEEQEEELPVYQEEEFIQNHTRAGRDS